VINHLDLLQGRIMSFEELKTMLTALEVPEEDIILEATREEAGLDSLMVVELVLALQEMGISITEEEINGSFTIADVVAVIDGRQAASA
jgi:acyl carrier protein